MKKSMSFADQIRLSKVVCGISWIVAGFSGFFDNIVCSIIQFLAYLIFPISIILISTAKKENPDEMANENLCKAKAKTLDIMCFCIAIIGIMAILIQIPNTISLDWSKVVTAAIFFVLGINELLVGVIFQKLEAE